LPAGAQIFVIFWARNVIDLERFANYVFCMKATSISTTDAARHLGDYLARVKHKGEHFLLTKNDQPIAELSPAKGTRRATWGDLVSAIARLPGDPSFADDLEKVNEADQPAANPWA
jgi:antitoxin (DNA-binding transcriptional repressor) of toxin-antitoxin stability system